MSDIYAQIREAAKYLHDPNLRSKIHFLLRALRSGNISLACEQFGRSRSSYYRWLHQLAEAGFDAQALQPKSRAPHRRPRTITGQLKEAILNMRQEFRYGPDLIAWYLNRMGYRVSPTGCYNVLHRADVPFRKRRSKKPNKHKRLYVLERPGQGIQMDIKYVPFLVENEKAYMFNAIDDCTRYRFAYVYRNLGFDPAVDFVKRLIMAMPFNIECIQTDNDISFTDRFLAKSPDYDLIHPVDDILNTLKILHKLIPPGIKELNGKVERSHKTDNEQFFWKLPRDITFDQLQYELAEWIHAYNHQRPHSSLEMKTPAQRLSEFGVMPRDTQRALAKLQDRKKHLLPAALKFATYLENHGLDSSYFRKQLPPPKKKRTPSISRLCHYLWNDAMRPASPMSQMSERSTKPLEPTVL